MGIGAVRGARSRVRKRRAVRGNLQISERPLGGLDLFKLPALYRNRVKPIGVEIAPGMVGRGQKQTLSTGQPHVLGYAQLVVRKHVDFSGCQIDDPEPRRFFAVNHNGVVLVLQLLVLFFCLRVGRQERDFRAVRRPFERRNRGLAFGQCLGLSSAYRNQENLGCAIASGQKCELFAIGRPARTPVLARSSEALNSATGRIENPDGGLSFSAFDRLRYAHCDPGLIRRQLEIRDPKSLQGLFRRQLSPSRRAKQRHDNKKRNFPCMT